MRTEGIQISLFPDTTSPEEHPSAGGLRCIAPRWVFGRIDKKKGRHLWVLKQHPDAAIVCITRPMAQQFAVSFPKKLSTTACLMKRG